MSLGTVMAETEATEGHSRVEWIALSIVLAAMTAVQFDAYLNHDVAWFGWAALQMLHGAQLGRDISNQTSRWPI